MIVPYSKYHALGNDFLVIEPPSGITRQKWQALARVICDRHHGVGADGILILKKGRGASDVTVTVVNADGSVAEKSGNGLRITGLYLARRSTARVWQIRMGGVVSEVSLRSRTRDGATLAANLGTPDFHAKSLPMVTDHRAVIGKRFRIAGKSLPLVCLSVGNPHAVVPVASFPDDWPLIGEKVERSRLFPQGTNVEFVVAVSRRRLRVKEWERGVGVTSSSGTGACAAVCAMVMLGLADRDCQVQFDGGTLHVSWNSVTSRLILTGPVVWVADGRYNWVC